MDISRHSSAPSAYSLGLTQNTRSIVIVLFVYFISSVCPTFNIADKNHANGVDCACVFNPTVANLADVPGHVILTSANSYGNGFLSVIQ